MDTRQLKMKMTGSLVLMVLAAAGLLFSSFIRRTIMHPNKKGSFKIDNLERTFLYYVPENIRQNPRLIIVYHGRNLTSRLMQLFTGQEFDILADKNRDVIVVYPQGYGKAWNDKLRTEPSSEGDLNTDDIRFTEQIIRYFKNEYKIDSTRIYGVGFSNGGQMVLTLAKMKPELFQRIAIISMNMDAEKDTTFNYPQKSVSIIYLSGVNDPVVPHRGGAIMLDGKNLGIVKSSEETLQYWLKVNQCDGSKPSLKSFVRVKDGKITATKEDYYSEQTGKKVSYVKILDGGHTIPNRRLRIPVKKLGNINREVDAPEMIWDFFMN